MGSDTDEATGKPRRAPHRNARKQLLVWTLVGGLLVAVCVYLFASETSVRELRSRTQDLVSSRVASRVVQSVESVKRATGAVSGGKDLARAEAVYQRNVKRREAAYGPRLDGQYLGKGAVFQYFQPIYPCVAEERVGSWKDGGKWLCDVSSLGPQSVVYSIGSYELVDFEEALYDLTSSEIHVFDHTLNSEQQARMKANEKFKYHAIGLGGAQKEGRLLPLMTIMETLKHSFVDVLKIDCEGCEFSVFPAIFQAFEGRDPPFGQIQLEVHEYHGDVWDNVRDLLTLIESRGYRMFHIDMNWECKECMEVAFIHESVVRSNKAVST
eukprot:TRINITY_DN17387_c0_g1_i1.p1 TRINITY_DN17387_c0_g1~~TRINITY_DN17387_c0_g1_i1.p1  ORF type:complete len:325 (+),score=67.59 TRINITY_DN17387_c0_g1_i1:314-1288(+)